MKLPDPYDNVLENLSSAEVNFGCGGIKLLSVPELEDAQLGYSVGPDGRSLCSGESGAWQPNWVVIGYETSCGDPLFIDVGAHGRPVFTAIHGEARWEPVQVAASIEAFGRCIEEFSRISVGRSNPVECEANPVGDLQRKTFLGRIAEFNQKSTALEFWALLLEC